jgi:hypothetical protein
VTTQAAKARSPRDRVQLGRWPSGSTSASNACDDPDDHAALGRRESRGDTATVLCTRSLCLDIRTGRRRLPVPHTSSAEPIPDIPPRAGREPEGHKVPMYVAPLVVVYALH